MTLLGGIRSGPRLRSMVIPREHGAWGMLLVPLATGLVAAGSSFRIGPASLFVMTALSFFCLRTPLETRLGTSPLKARTTEERTVTLGAAIGFAALGLLGIVALFAYGLAPGLVTIGILVALAFAGQILLKRLGRRGRMPSQIVGAIGLTSTAAGAFYVAAGHLNQTALALWAANWLFAANQIHFVQLRIRSGRAMTIMQRLRQGRWFLAAQLVLLVIVSLLAVSGFFSGLLLLAFLPATLRGAVWFLGPQRPLNVHRLGFSELAQSLVFGVLLCVAVLSAVQ